MRAKAGIPAASHAIMQKGGWIYIMTNRRGGTLYIGVTSDLVVRASQHRSGAAPVFTKTYRLRRLVYFERYDDIVTAITREKVLRKRGRAWKVALIEKDNMDWRDLHGSIL